jgi:hypothetical protein
MKVSTKQAVFVLFTMFLVPPASAGSFSESFKNWILEPETSVSVIRDEQISLDVASDECVQCHNGRDSGHIVVKSARSAMQFTASGRQSNHPVGMNYDQFVSDQPSSYSPRSELDPNIFFANGKVVCLSCHLPKGKAKNAGHRADSDLGLARVSYPSPSIRDSCTARKTLTVGPRTTDLCLSCHTI